MLKTTSFESTLPTPETQGPAAPASETNRRRVQAGKLARRSALPAHQPPARVPSRPAMAGVDALEQVTNWTLFSTEARNERQAHQTERANRSQASELTQQQAELAAQAARAQSAYHTGGLARVQACRDAVGHVKNTLDASDAQVKEIARRDAEQAQAARQRPGRPSGEQAGAAAGAAAPERELRGAPSGDVRRVEGGTNAGL